MGRRRKPWWGAGPYEDFRQKVVQRFDSFDSDIMGYLNIMYNAGLIPQNAQLVPNPQGARWQATGGSRTDGTEGAHCLPCQIMIALSPGITDPSDLAPNQRVREEIRSLFAHITVLPGVFNSADVVAENCRLGGLRQVFVAAGQAVIRGQRRDKEHRYFRDAEDPMTGEFRDGWLLNRALVRAAYRTIWIPRAELAYKSAMDEVEAGRLDQYLLPLARREAPEPVMEILSAYLKYHRVAEPSKLLDPQMDELERQFNAR